MKNTSLGLRLRRLKSLFRPAVLAGLAVTLLSADRLQAQATVTTIGGGAYSQPYAGYVNGNTLTTAKFAMPCGMAIDSTATHLYIADYTNNAIRVVTAITDSANCTTATWATNGVSHPIAVALDGAGGVYVLNRGTGANGAVLHFTGAGSTAVAQPTLASSLVNATAMAIDGANNLFVTVNGNKVIRVSPTGVVTNFGTITNTTVSLQGIAVLDTGKLALTDSGNNGIWIMNADGTSAKLTGFHGAGDILGSASVAAFRTPETIAEAGSGILVVADCANHKVKLIDTTGNVSLLCGVSSNLWVTGTGHWPGWADGTATTTKGSAECRLPYGVVVAPDGSVIVDEDYYHVLRHVTSTGLTAPPAPGVPSSGSGGGAGGTQSFAGPAGIAYDATDNFLFVAVTTNNAVQLLNLNDATNAASTFVSSLNGVTNPVAVLLDTEDNLYVLNQGKSATNGYILEFDIYGNAYGPIVTGLIKPTAFMMDGVGNIFVTEQSSNIFAFGAGVSNVVVTVTNANASLQGIALFDDGALAVSDAGNHVIWLANPSTKLVTLLTGQIGASGAAVGSTNFAKFNQPRQLVRVSGNQLVGADYGNNRLVLISRTGAVSTNKFLTGAGSTIWYGNNATDPVLSSTNSRFVPMVLPVGVAVDNSGDVFASESFYGDVRKIPGTALGIPSSNPGVPLPVNSNPPGGAQTLAGPAGIAYDSVDNLLFVTVTTNNAVQVLDLTAATNATGTFVTSADGVTNPVAVLLDAEDNLYVLNRGRSATSGYILEFDIYGNAYGPIVTGLITPTAFTMDGSGNIFVTEQSSNIFGFGAGVSNIVVTVTNANASLQGIALFDDGALAVSDAGNDVIWLANPITKLVTRLTGQIGASGTAVGSTNFAKFNQPRQLVHVSGNQLVGADYGNNRLVLISRTGAVSTNKFLTGAGSTIWYGNNATDPVLSTNSRFVPMVLPVGVAVDNSGDVFASESFYGDVRKIPGTALGIPSSNPGVPLPVYSSPAGMSLNNESTVLFVADSINNTISALTLANNQTTVFLDETSGIYQPVDVAVDVNDNIYVLNQGTGGNGSIMEFDKYGNFLGTEVGSLPMPTAMKLDFAGSFVVAELNGLVQEFASDGGSNTLANITINANVRLHGIAVLDTGSVIVSDSGNHVLWKIAPGATNAVLFTGVLGTPGTHLGGVGFAKLNAPMGIAQANGGLLAIADSGNNQIVVANDAGTITSVLNSTNADLWFGLSTDPLTSSSPNFVRMLSPVGLVIDQNGTVFDSEAIYKVVRGILNTGLQPPVKPAPPSAPRIGWFDYETVGADYVTVLHPVTTATFNNDQLLAIDPNTNGVSTYYVYGPAPLNSVPGPTNGTTPPFYQDGLFTATSLPVYSVPDLVIDAVNVDSIGQVSPITKAEFIFKVANPTITGFNGAQFTVSDITDNALLYYTLDGTDPTNGPPSIGPISLSSSNTAVLSLVVNTNVLFKVRGFRNGYYPSGTAVQFFSPSNFVANTLSFGFASGEASSAYVAAAGQTFYAPVTLSVLPNVNMYSLQFNIVVTNGGPNPGPAVVPGSFGFQSMLMKPDPDVPGLYLPIPPYMFANDDSGPVNPSQLVTYEGTNFVNLLTVNSALNLLTVGWLERYSETNLYVTKNQDLIAMSMAHDDLFLQANGKVIVGGYSFQVPPTATNNQTYQIQIGRPSATSDGIGAPGSDVYIAAPTNGTLGAGSPVNALKFVTVGQIKYLVGSVYPFGWFNAGDFGSSNLVNADVEQVFQSAIYQLNSPPAGSDFFDAMDSCGGTYVDLGNGYLEFNTFISGPSATNPLFNGDDSSIDQIAFGDGVLDVCDVYVTFRRSLDPSRTWFQRYWNNGQRVATTGANVASHALKAPASKVVPKSLNTSAVAPQVNFSAGDVVGAAGQTLKIPITANILGSYPLRVLMLNLSVVPLDGSPALTSPVSFSQVASNLGSPYIASSDGAGNFSAAWLKSTNSGLTGSVTLGTLSVPIPATAGSTAAYAIHFDHASASPNGLASFPNTKLTGLLTTATRTNSSYGDGIPDAWRLRWFGTVNNVLSASNACPSGDGVPNWKKYVAGVDPNTANDFPSVNARTPAPKGSTTAVHWPSVSGKQYVIQRANNLFLGPWTVLSTNAGTGGDMEYDDTNTASQKFYRIEILP